jgi:putative flippase GtrA
VKKNIPIRLIPIDTVYLNDNPSHFHPVLDSFRVYRRPLKFAAASLTCAAADLLIFTAITQTLSVRLAALTLIATVAARISSGTLNFILNRNWSFEVRHMWRPQAIRYLGLFLFIMASSWLLVWGFSFLPVALTILKAVVDTGLFVFSYIAQRDWVFTKGRVLG